MHEDLRKSILVIHPDEAQLKKLRRVLAESGFDILTAPNETIARELFGKLAVEMVICQPQFTRLSEKNKP